MTILASNIDVRSETYLANRAAMEASLARYRELVDQAVAGGGDKYV